MNWFGLFCIIKVQVVQIGMELDVIISGICTFRSIYKKEELMVDMSSRLNGWIRMRWTYLNSSSHTIVPGVIRISGTTAFQSCKSLRIRPGTWKSDGRYDAIRLEVDLWNERGKDDDVVKQCAQLKVDAKAWRSELFFVIGAGSRFQRQKSWTKECKDHICTHEASEYQPAKRIRVRVYAMSWSICQRTNAQTKARLLYLTFPTPWRAA